MIYYARKGETRTNLSKSSQMQKVLDAGFSIYAETEAGKSTLVATPEDGFLVEEPVFPVPMTSHIGSGNPELEKVLNILLGIED